VSDGERIYAILANGIVQAVDLAGKAAWTSFVSAKQNTAYGRSASPVLSGGKLFVHMTNLYAFDPASGRQLWVNAEARCQYGTPAVLRANQESLVVTPAGDVLRAADGKALNDKIGNTSNVSPLVQDGLIYYAEKEIRAVRLGADFKDESVWDGEIPGEVFGSPIVHNGLLFTSTGKGELVVFDLQKKGSPPVFEPRQLFGEEAGGLPLAYSSFALAGNHLFIVSNGGEVAVLEATREAKRVALNRLTDGSGASPVFSGKQIFLRDGDKLYCIGAQP
jgi:hypothetical protein